jgi:hypothetical protein
MKFAPLLLLFASFVANAGALEYQVNGETRLYDSDCYWNAPEKIAPSADGGGYNVIVPITRDDCRVRGSFAKVNIYKYDFVTSSMILFEGSWVPTTQAEKRKAKLDAAYKNVLNAGFATQVVKLDIKNF